MARVMPIPQREMDALLHWSPLLPFRLEDFVKENRSVNTLEGGSRRFKLSISWELMAGWAATSSIAASALQGVALKHSNERRIACGRLEARHVVTAVVQRSASPSIAWTARFRHSRTCPPRLAASVVREPLRRIASMNS